MSTEVTTLEQPRGIPAALSVQHLTDRAIRIQEILKKVMKRGVHYGVIPGCGDKPGLRKAGAEKILSTFELGAIPDQSTIRDLGDEAVVRVRVIVPIVHCPTGRIVGHGVGECSSAEEKFAWRKAVCEDEWNDTDPVNRREKWKVDKGGRAYKVKQVRMVPADVANTVLKMAKKRGVVDGTLTATACSDMFEQGEDVTGDEDEGFDRERASQEEEASWRTAFAMPGYMGPHANRPIDDPAVPVQALQDCAEGLARALEKPPKKGKEKWRQRDEALLPALRAEIARRQAAASQAEDAAEPDGDPAQPTAQEIFEDLEATADLADYARKWKAYLPILAGLGIKDKDRINALHARKQKELS